MSPKEWVQRESQVELAVSCLVSLVHSMGVGCPWFVEFLIVLEDNVIKDSLWGQEKGKTLIINTICQLSTGTCEDYQTQDVKQIWNDFQSGLESLTELAGVCLSQHGYEAISLGLGMLHGHEAISLGLRMDVIHLHTYSWALWWWVWS